MKKILAALLVASFGAGLMAQSLVYDYKASIKRLDAQFALKSANKTKFIASSYKVASDTIDGKIVLPRCEACDEGTISSTVNGYSKSPNVDWAYLVLKGDKYSKKNKMNYILKTKVTARAAIFGAYINAQDDSTPLADIRSANKAWMAIDYELPAGDDIQTINFDKVLPGYGNPESNDDNLFLGFLSLTNNGVKRTEASVKHTGFGAVKVDTWEKRGSFTLCGKKAGKNGSCQYVSSISGTLVGYPTYEGPCRKTPMWDVCYYNGSSTEITKNTNIVSDGVICGSWTLKFNSSLTDAYNKEKTDKEGVILKKLGGDSKYMYQVPAQLPVSAQP